MVKNDVPAASKKENKDNSAKAANKTGVSVTQLATDIGVSIERLMTQFKDAKIKVSTATDVVSEEEKQKLLRYLQQHHGAKSGGAAPEKIVLRRAKTSEIKVGGSHHGGGKTVSIQVRKKRT